MQINSASAIAASAAQAVQTAQQTTNLVEQSTVYSANVGGKVYTAEISSSAGGYTATVPNHLPPISANGSSLVLAESNLASTISLLV
jgi:hypothetical protein